MRKGNKLLNFSTSIEPVRTATEIMSILASKGAKSINVDYASGEPVGLSFKIEINGVEISYKLPCNYEGAERAMKRNPEVQPRYKTPLQARRVAWRIIKDWIEAQMAIVEMGQAELAEVFLPYALNSKGQTLFQYIAEDPTRLLTDGSESNVVQGRFLASGE